MYYCIRRFTPWNRWKPFWIVLNMFIFKYVSDNKIECFFWWESRNKAFPKHCPEYCRFQAGPLWGCFIIVSFFLAARGCTFFGKTLPLCPELGILLLGAAWGVLLLSWKLTWGKKKKEEAKRAQKSVFHSLELKLGEDQFGSCFTWGPEDKELRRISRQPPSVGGVIQAWLIAPPKWCIITDNT